MIRPGVRRGVEVLLLAAVYTCVAKLGLMLDAVGGFATLVWPASGLALAVLLKRGVALWPGVALGALVTNLWVGAPPAAALGVAAGNTLEAVLAATALQRLFKVEDAFDRLSQVVGLILTAALGSTLVAAALGVFSLRIAGTIPAAQSGAAFRAWWVGDALGDLVVAPLLLAWTRDLRGMGRLSRRPPKLAEAMALTGLLTGLGLVIFSGLLSPANAFGQVYLLFPLVAWAALRFHLRGASFATLLISVIAVWFTAGGHGPFVRESMATSLLFLQVFMGMIAATALFLAGAILERDRAVKARDSLLAIVSHDLKNPLQAISLHAQMLTRKLDKDEPARRLVGQLERAADRMTLLVGDLLDASAIEAGELTVRLEPVDARSLVEEAIEPMAEVAASRGQSLKLDAPEGAPWVSCDRNRVIQVLLNLVDNALKYTPDESEVKVSLSAVPNGVRFSVRDSGKGIPSRELGRVFDPFWRGGSERPGTGLGLSIAKRIVEAHGGRLWVESPPEAGATFSFELPAADPPLSEPAKSVLV